MPLCPDIELTGRAARLKRMAEGLDNVQLEVLPGSKTEFRAWEVCAVPLQSPTVL